MNDLLERELKLDIPPGFSLARLGTELDAYLAAPVALARLHAITYDTPDLRLARWGVRLTYRYPDGWSLTLPQIRGGRAVHLFSGPIERIPAEALDLATAYLRGAEPVAAAELRTLRASRRVRSYDGQELAEIVEDDVRVIADRRVVKRFRRVEIELAPSAPDELLDLLVDRLQHQGAGLPDPTPDEVIALGPGAAEPPIAVPGIDTDGSVGDLFRAAFAEPLEKLTRADAEVRSGPDDPEPVHQARVATRRLRSHLRTFAAILDPEWARALGERLQALGERLGAARDADVLPQRLGERIGALPAADHPQLEAVLKPFRAERGRAYGELQRALREPAYVTLLDELVAAAEHPPFLAGAEQTIREATAPIMDGVWRKLRKAVRKRERPPTDPQLHRIRIKAKRVRYAAEAFALAYGRPASTFAERVETLQTVLGEQHDAVVATRRLREQAGDVALAFAAGELAALEQCEALAGRRRWRKAWRAAKARRCRFW